MEIQNQVIPAQVKDIELTATLPNEMIIAQQQLITWCDGKIQVTTTESVELRESYEHAKEMKWKYTALQTQYNRAIKRISYYEKIKEALLAGYYIVPNFDVEIFAIRTKREKPLKFLSTSQWDTSRTEQPAHDVALGEGDYVNNRPIVYEKGIGDNKKHFWAERWQDIEFPVTMAKPMIMEATTQAMKQKIFDRFGVFPSTRKKTDPVIIGQIAHKESQSKERIVSFMIAWHINTNVI
jgi:hypothetical protein